MSLFSDKACYHAPVDADCRQVEDGGGTAHDVTRHPRVTHYVTERPHTVVDLKMTSSSLLLFDSDPIAHLTKTLPIRVVYASGSIDIAKVKQFRLQKTRHYVVQLSLFVQNNWKINFVFLFLVYSLY